jgi:hypothetical protein
VKRLAEVTQKAKKDASRILTAQLRQQALEGGWDAEVVRNLKVVHKDGGFHTHIHPDYQSRAFTHEYGDENNQPTAIIRKFMSDPHHIDTAFAVSVDHHWKESK